MSEPVYQCLRVEREGERLSITFDRPERRNALTHAMMLEIGDAVARAREDAGLRVVVLRGAGGNFCAGGDLDAMMHMPPPPAAGRTDPLIAPYRVFGDVLTALDRLPQAVVAVVEGACAGGGLGMACCADVVIAHKDATLGMPEPRVGFIPSQIIPFVVRRLGPSQARRLAVMALRFRGREALDYGIAHYCADDGDEVEALLAQVLAELHSCHPGALAAVKRHVIDCIEQDDAAVMDGAVRSLVQLLRAPEALDGISAFKARRPPPWSE